MGEISERQVLAQVRWRLLPLLFLLYVVNILDRVNVSFARFQMLEDLGMGEKEYAFGFSIFYLGYVLFEVPSNLILARTGARRWIARILMSWGVISCAMMAIQGPRGFMTLRVLLGFAEAGFFPGIILYLTYWFPARERARAVALFMVGAPLTGALGNPLSGAIMQFMDHFCGLRGWQWLFLLEGLPAVVLGFVVLWCLPDRPEQAGWLTPEERVWLTERVGREEKQRTRLHGLTLLRAAGDFRVWLLTLLYFTVATGSNATGSYMPKLIETRFKDLGPFKIGLLTAIPNILAIVCMVLNGLHSDRTGERRWHVAVPAFLAAVGWVLAAQVDSPVGMLVGLSLAQAGVMSTLPVFWSLPTAFLSGSAAAGGIALINALGNLGGFVGPNVIAQFEAAPGDFTRGLLATAAVLALGGILALCARHHSAAEGATP
jgi:ACS family tartrate transporter-like MFS transporter